MRKNKIHPHIKSFIHSVVMAEMSPVGPSKSYIWKESLMKEVQEHILDRLNEVKTQEDLAKVTSEEINKLSVDFKSTLEMINLTLRQIPVDILKQPSMLSKR